MNFYILYLIYTINNYYDNMNKIHKTYYNFYKNCNSVIDYNFKNINLKYCFELVPFLKYNKKHNDLSTLSKKLFKLSKKNKKWFNQSNLPFLHIKVINALKYEKERKHYYKNYKLSKEYNYFNVLGIIKHKFKKQIINDLNLFKLNHYEFNIKNINPYDKTNINIIISNDMINKYYDRFKFYKLNHIIVYDIGKVINILQINKYDLKTLKFISKLNLKFTLKDYIKFNKNKKTYYKFLDYKVFDKDLLYKDIKDYNISLQIIANGEKEKIKNNDLEYSNYHYKVNDVLDIQKKLSFDLSSPTDDKTALKIIKQYINESENKLKELELSNADIEDINLVISELEVLDEELNNRQNIWWDDMEYNNYSKMNHHKTKIKKNFNHEIALRNASFEDAVCYKVDEWEK